MACEVAGGVGGPVDAGEGFDGEYGSEGQTVASSGGTRPGVRVVVGVRGQVCRTLAATAVVMVMVMVVSG